MSGLFQQSFIELFNLNFNFHTVSAAAAATKQSWQPFLNFDIFIIKKMDYIDWNFGQAFLNWH